jgi:hypothetical protein
MHWSLWVAIVLWLTCALGAAVQDYTPPENPKEY